MSGFWHFVTHDGVLLLTFAFITAAQVLNILTLRRQRAQQAARARPPEAS